MRIEIIGDESVSRQALIYAEYRLFAALSESVQTERIQRAALVLRQPAPSEGDRTLCAITVDTDGGNLWRATTAGDHPYAAINGAVDRIRTGQWPAHARLPVRADHRSVNS